MFTPRLPLSARMNSVLITLIYRCFHSYRTSISILEPVWPDHAITTQREPNSNFLQTKWVVLMLMKLRVNPEAHIMFVHVTTKVEICLVTEK